MARGFMVRTRPWRTGFEIYIYEDDVEVGTTQTELGTEGAALGMANDWIKLQYGLADDEYYTIYGGNYTVP